MSDRFLAFRCFGDYGWPPLRDVVPGETTVKGVVEIHYVLDAAAKKLVGCLRWVPKAQWALDLSFDTSLAAIEYVQGTATAQAQAQAALLALFSDPEQIITLRFDVPPTGNYLAIVLAFKGVHLFEQYAIRKEQAGQFAHELEMRIPVIKNYFAQFSSRVLIGQDTDDLLRLDLAVPLATPLDDEQYQEDLAFLRFSALYASRIASTEFNKQAQGLKLDSAVFGRQDRGIQVDLSNLKAPWAKVLGKFIFAKDSIGNQLNEHACVEIRGSDRWPTVESIVKNLFPALGLRTTGVKTTSFEAEPDIIDPALLPAPSVAIRALSENNQAGFRIEQRFFLSKVGSPNPVFGDDPDIRIKSGIIELRAPGMDNVWIKFGDKIHITLVLSGTISDTDLWTDQHALKVEASIGGAMIFAYSMLTQGNSNPVFSDPKGEGLSFYSLLCGAVPAMDRARLALHQLAPDQPQSALPGFIAPPRGKDGLKHFGLFGQFDGRYVAGKPLRLEASDWSAMLADPNNSSVFNDPKLAFEQTRIELIATWPSLHRLPVPIRCSLTCDTLHDNTRNSSGMRFGLQQTSKLPDKTSLTAILGALELVHVNGLFLKEGWIRISTRSDSGVKKTSAALGIELGLTFNVATVDPIAVDVLRSDRSGRAQPLMYREQEEAVGAGIYLLKCKESIRGDQQWRLTASLSEDIQSNKNIVASLLFGQEPFAIQRFYSMPLDTLGGEDNATIASYDSDDRGWKFKLTSPLYHYVLPPQSVGESMDKPRRLELHDFDETSALLADGFIRPTTAQQSGLCRRAVEFRLTPPAHLWVQPNDVERNYSLPEWASGEIFSQHSELGLGCALSSLQCEFIYGLAFGITSKLEQGPARRTRVTEIEALTGRPVPKDDRAAGAMPSRWNLLHKALQTRPQRLELWADDPGQEVRFAPVRFSDGARFALRTTALHRPAVEALEIAVDKDTSPGAPTQAVPGLSPRLHPFGLSGGALWPIESANVLNLILNKPLASGGSIEKIALSPLGGDADQTVKFNNNRVAIVSETRGGFVQRQKVEVIGRISVFWHRAKHVVVYERTVNPSAQFTPIEGLGTRTRRPVLRKISEYIEILEPERRYPDTPNVAAHTSSFLRALRFNKRIIAVDSLWAEEVDTTGWIVPLWNRHAARQRPQVYPLPDIAFVTASEGEGDDPQAAQECLNPENLYFFADTNPDQTDNTDAWAIRKGIDYVDLPPPKFVAPTDGTPRPAHPTSVPTGYTRFTWRLAPASQRTTINAGRADKPVYTGLETLTFMRAGRQEAGTPVSPRAASGQRLIEGVSSVGQTTSAVVFKGFWGNGVELQGPLAGLSTSLANVVNGLPSTPPSDENEKTAIKARFQTLAESASPGSLDNSGLTQLLEEISQPYLKAFLPLTNDLNDLDQWIAESKPCKSLFDNLVSAIGAKRLAIVQEVESWREEWIRKLDPANPLPEYLASRSNFEQYLEEQLNQLLQPVFESASGELGKMRRGIEIAHLTATEAIGAVHTSLDRAQADLDALKKSIDQGKPWSLARRIALEKQLQVVFTQADASLKREVSIAKQRLAAELDDLSQWVGVITARAIEDTLQGDELLQHVLESDLSLVRRLNTLRNALPNGEYIRVRIDNFDRAIEAIQTAHPDQDEALQPIRDFIEKAQATLVDADTRLYPQLLGVLQSFENTLSAEVQQAATDLTELLELLVDDTKKLRLDLQTTLSGVEKDLLLTLDSTIAALPVVLADETKRMLKAFGELDQWFNCLFDLAEADLEAADHWLAGNSEPIYDAIEEAANAVLNEVSDIEAKLSGAPLVKELVHNFFQLPAFVTVIDRLGPPVFDIVQSATIRITAATTLLNSATDAFVKSLENATELLEDLKPGIQGACEAVSTGVSKVREQLKTADAMLQPFKDRLQRYKTEIFDQLDNAFGDPEQYKTLLKNVQAFDLEVRELGNKLALSRNLLESYGERVIDAVGRLGDGGLLSAPNNILRAMAAFGSTPRLPNLDFSSLCSPYFLGRVDDCVDMAPINAWFGRLGDDLKALGLDLPVDRISDRLLPMDLSKFDIGRVLNNVGGLDLGSLLRGYSLPAGARDAIRITHEFDKKNSRAWVQVDVDLPLPERRALFSVGPFTLDVINARVSAVVRLEASKDSAKVEQSGTATLLTDFDAVVGGQSMVTLNQVAVRFDKSSGLNVDFDPKKIKLNPSFQFIQNTFQSIFGDDIGGLKVIKENGIPIGVEHLFSLPPMGMMFGTSGVQNIQISNAFRLLAFPDFLISNSFALARSDLPFVFSVFIIGGSGWLTIDVNYRPFNNELAVVVDAAVGGSASLGFSFCGVSGTVSISLNVALTYRKLIGKPGGGLTVSMVVVIVGVVDVLRIASAYIGVTLRLSYQENGDIDATGTFRVSIRISRFFSVSAGGQVRYRMTGGREERTSSTHGEVQSQSYEKAKKLINGQGR